MKPQIRELSQSVCFLAKEGQTQAMQWIASYAGASLKVNLI